MTKATRTIQQLFDLKGKTALVTGSSRGLGLQMAQALGEAGARVMLSSRKDQDLIAAAAELKSAGIDVDWIAADCSKEADIRSLPKHPIANGVKPFSIRDEWYYNMHWIGDATDVKEANNLAAAKPEVVRELKQLVMDWRATWPQSK